MRPLEIKGLTHHYGDSTVLENISLSVEPGELVGILGASGSGKSTLLRSIAGFITPTSGQITLNGVTVAKDGKEQLPPEQRRVGMVFQDYALFEHMTVFDNVAYGIHRDPNRQQRVAELLELVGLSGFEQRMPNTLSGGQQQRVALVRALAPEPTLLLLDEPFANLDGSLLRGLGQELKRVLRTQGVAGLLVTHERAQALGLSDRVAILDGQSPGKLVQVGTPEEVYTRPVTPGAAVLTGHVSFLSGHANGDVAETALGNIPIHPSTQGSCRIVIRPEQIRLAGQGPSATVTYRRFEGTGYALGLECSGESLYGFCAVVDAPTAGERVQIEIHGTCTAVSSKG